VDRMGESGEPWGVPWFKTTSGSGSPLNDSVIWRSVRKDRTQCRACTRCGLGIGHFRPRDGSRVARARRRDTIKFLTHFTSSSSPRSFRFPHLPPSLSANRTQATYSQDLPLATHQAPSAEETRIAQIGPANDKPEDDTAPRCTRSALPLPTVPRSGPKRKDSE